MSVRMPEGEPSLRVLYVQPEAGEGGDAVGFAEFADAIDGTGEMGALFAERLRSWAAKAGAVEPKATPPLNDAPFSGLPPR